MASIMVHITHGPEHPTRVALGLLVARTATEEGHDVSLFLAGDAVQLVRDETLDAVNGVGTGSAREHFDALTSAGGRVYLSRMSSNARGISETDASAKGAQMAAPTDLVRLSLEHDSMFTY
ncbi:MAG: DsrE family protein [Actinomycetota bacterium]|nr:DsrE family protein [Actinomycetota bacterium]